MSEVTLPVQLAETDFSLEEIGGIFVLCCLFKMSDAYKTKWSNNDKLSNIVEKLIKSGIADVSNDDADEPALNIDLTKLEKVN